MFGSAVFMFDKFRWLLIAVKGAVQACLSRTAIKNPWQHCTGIVLMSPVYERSGRWGWLWRCSSQWGAARGCKLAANGGLASQLAASRAELEYTPSFSSWLWLEHPAALLPIQDQFDRFSQPAFKLEFVTWTPFEFDPWKSSSLVWVEYEKREYKWVGGGE